MNLHDNLSPTELYIMNLLAIGKTQQEIADSLGYTYVAVQKSVKGIKKVLKCDNVNGIIRYAILLEFKEEDLNDGRMKIYL